MEDNLPRKRRKLNPSIASPYFENERLGENFFNVLCTDLAKNLLGKVLVRRLDSGSLLKGKIVETECYPGAEDKASYSYNGRRTPRNEPMYMRPGTVFVYKTYGMYHCFNISSKNDGAAVLLRSIEPIHGIERMTHYRTTYHQRRKSKSKNLMVSNNIKKNIQQHELCNGPSKLCISFDITSENCNKEDLCTSNIIWIEEGIDQVLEKDIISSTRIGIDSAGLEWASKLYRFYIINNKHVSVRDKEREKLANS